jgi:nucleoside-diphosphate-sugar epimerase
MPTATLWSGGDCSFSPGVCSRSVHHERVPAARVVRALRAEMGRRPATLAPQASARHAFGAELRRWRIARRLTHRALAVRVWHSQEALAKVEKAQRWPSLDLAVRCDLVLGTGGGLAALWPAVERQRLAADGRRRPSGTPSAGTGSPSCGGHVLVTGGGGFIGGALTRRLLGDGWRVTAVDRRPDGIRRLGGCTADLRRLRPVMADLQQLDLRRLLVGVDAVVHLAGRGNVRESWRDPAPFVRDNVEVTDRLMRAVAAEHQVRVVVVASSSSVYAGAPPWTELALARPASPYGMTKLAAERAAFTHLGSDRRRLVVARLFSVYGPGQRPDLVLSRLIDSGIAGGVCRLHGDGRQRRDFTYIDDAVECLARLLASDVAGVFNVCTGNSYSLLDLVRELRDGCGHAIRFRCDGRADERVVGAAHTLGVNTKLIAACGPQAWTSLRVGVRRQLAWQLARVADRPVTAGPGCPAIG